MTTKPHVIDLIVDGKLHGMRHWRNVPRVGDIVLIDGNARSAKVNAVIWSDSGEDACVYDAWVQLVCKTVKHVVADKAFVAGKTKGKKTP